MVLGVSLATALSLSWRLFQGLARGRIIWRNRSGEDFRNIPAALKVPRSRVASSVVEWKNQELNCLSTLRKSVVKDQELNGDCG